MSAELKSTNQGQTLILTLSDPALRNAMGPAMYAAGIEALNVAETNPDIRSVVITGEGAHFCAGSDVQRLKANREQPAEVQAQIIESLHSWMEAVRTFPKPIIAAVEGAAVGSGFSLALMCDLVVAAQNSVFATAYSNLALSPDAGASWHLTKMLPRQLATELLLLGDRISAQRLHELGVVNRVVDSGHALSEALALAERINARAPNVMNSIKELVNDASMNSLTAQLAQERNQFVKNLHHPNAGIGIQAFLNQETPNYK
ncbi:enoyl-CoA hydratase [Limnohabitans sp. MORI2]|uniref:oxepin-CoA hydrolase, alternative type n=1 Tax=Limnohabitans sp. MORI2 TaxID=1751150 RepID=UPI002376E891|nr:enoyl-CoA hydratase [Limnohabitans sp. MORI2]BDU58195.1 enoyl-CoA hydratase [Limnohabitans sp. MORI2]